MPEPSSASITTGGATKAAGEDPLGNGLPDPLVHTRERLARLEEGNLVTTKCRGNTRLVGSRPVVNLVGGGDRE
jgi:hypothetical protein